VTRCVKASPPKGGEGLRAVKLIRLDVAAEVHQRFDRFGYERGCLLRVGEGVGAGLRRFRVPGADREHFSLDDARVAVVDGSQDRDRTPSFFAWRTKSSRASAVPDSGSFTKQALR